LLPPCMTALSTFGVSLSHQLASYLYLQRRWKLRM